MSEMESVLDIGTAEKHKTKVSKQYKKRSPIAEVWRQMKKNKGAIVGLIILGALVFLAVSADLIYNYETDIIQQNISARLQWPSWEHPMGTDELGRDVMARLIYGARFSLSVGVVAVLVALVLGVTMGAIAGFYGGHLENVIMRFTDISASIPSILLAIAIVAALGQSTINLMLAVGVTSTPAFVRVSRAAVLMVKSQEYIESAKAIGVRSYKIILFHVLPNSLSPIIVQATLRVASAIISAAGLSFLGLGIPAPEPEWGGMLSAGRMYIRDSSYLTFFPGLAIMITVLALNLVGDALRDALDPRLKQ